jgi:hypothetical protein
MLVEGCQPQGGRRKKLQALICLVSFSTMVLGCNKMGPFEVVQSSAITSSPVADKPVHSTTLQVSPLMLPLNFVPNVGQTDSAMRFLMETRTYTAFLAPNEVIFSASYHIQEVLVSFRRSAYGSV